MKTVLFIPEFEIKFEYRKYYYSYGVSMHCFNIKIKKLLEILTSMKIKFESVSIISNVFIIQSNLSGEKLDLTIQYLQDNKFEEAVKMILALAFFLTNIIVSVNYITRLMNFTIQWF